MEGEADALLWELAAIEEELRKKAGLADEKEAQLGEPIVPGQAQTGDVVLVRVPEDVGSDGTGHAVGLCNGRSVLVLDRTGRIEHVHLGASLCAWRVGRAA